MNPQPPVLETGALAGLSYWPAEIFYLAGRVIPASGKATLLFRMFRMFTTTRAKLAAFQLFCSRLTPRGAVIAALAFGTF